MGGPQWEETQWEEPMGGTQWENRPQWEDNGKEKKPQWEKIGFLLQMEQEYRNNENVFQHILIIIITHHIWLYC